MVKALYEERNSRLQVQRSKPPKGNGGNGEKPSKGNGGDGSKPTPSPPSSSSSSFSYSFTSIPSQTPTYSPKGHRKTPLLNLDIKFEFPTYNGEVNIEKLDNLVHHIEVYCRIQNIKDGETKIQLVSLRLESATLIWYKRI